MAEFTRPKIFSNLKAISSLDGRFRGNVENYSNYFSEYATMKLRVEIEIKYLIAILVFLGETKLTESDIKELSRITDIFSERDAEWIQNKDLIINHDTKSIEYYLKKKLAEINFKHSNFVHIGLTSADIDNNALVLSVKRFEEEILARLRKSIILELQEFVSNNRNGAFLARTHGKPAVPTTMGKEVQNFLSRLNKLDNEINKHIFEGKLTGAVGNFNALISTYPEKDWEQFSIEFIENLSLVPNLHTTQILPYDNIIQYLNLIGQFNNILIDLSRDFWSYISIGLLSLNYQTNEVGSSTMPHKVNPISFEGAEAYSLLSSNLISFFSRELSTNRMQRDLTDKYISREIGVSLVQAALSYSMILGGVKNIEFNSSVADGELDDHWEILGEAVQTILRMKGFTESYEIIKELTRGKNITKKEFLKILNDLDGLSDDTKKILERLNPRDYLGWAKHNQDK